YRWRPRDFPAMCACGKASSVDHALDCRKGGYIIWRHDCVKKKYAQLMEEAGMRDVRIEPRLLPLPPERQRKGRGGETRTTDSDDARLDVACVGFWGAQQRAFFDIRITNPLAPSYAHTPVETHLANQEHEKRTDYQERVIQIEKGSFTPLVHTTSGGCGR